MRQPDSQRVILLQDGKVSVARRPLGALGPDQILLRMDVLGLCSSDFHIWAGRKSGKPGVLGHEGAGTVIAAGSEVRDWAEGDFAVVNPLLNCGACEVCRAGMGHICERREIVGYNGRGLMADYQIVESRCLFRPPAALSRHYGAMVEPLACVVHGQDLLGAEVEQSMLILGAGPMGVLHAAYAKHRGVRMVWLADPDERKLELAQANGVPADQFLPLGADHRLEAAIGAAAAEVSVIANSARSGHRLAFDQTAHGGTVLGFASILDEPGPFRFDEETLDTDQLHRIERRLAILVNGRRVTFQGAIGFDGGSFRKSSELLAGPIDGSRFITASVGLEDVPALIDGSWHHHLKILVDPSKGSREDSARHDAA